MNWRAHLYLSGTIIGMLATVGILVIYPWVGVGIIFAAIYSIIYKAIAEDMRDNP